MGIKYPLIREDSAPGAAQPLQSGDTLRIMTPDTVTKTTAFNALANYSYSLNSSSGTFNVALPTTADNGAMIMLADVNGAAGTEHIVIKQSTTTIAIINQAYGVAYLSYNANLAKWSVVTLSAPYLAMSNYEALYVNPTYGDDTTGTGLINNPFKTIQAAINSFTAGSPHVIYVRGSTTQDITFRTGDQSMRIVLDPKTEHTGTVTFVAGNTSIYFNCPSGDSTISGTINDASSGNIYWDGYILGTYNKTGGSGSISSPAGYVEFSTSSNIDGLVFNLSGYTSVQTLGTGNMGLLTLSTGIFNARHAGTMLCPVITSPANPLLGIPVFLANRDVNLLVNGSTRVLDARNLTYGQVFIAGASAFQATTQTLGILDFTGASASNVVCTIWGSSQLAKSGNILPTLTSYANDSNNIWANTSPSSYVSTDGTIRGDLNGIDTALAGIPVSTASNITSSNTDTVYTATKTYRITNTSGSSITFTCTGTRTFLGTTFGNSSTVLTIPASAVAVIQVLSATSVLIKNLSSFSASGGTSNTFKSISTDTALTSTDIGLTGQLSIYNSSTTTRTITLPTSPALVFTSTTIWGNTTTTFVIPPFAVLTIATYGTTAVAIISVQEPATRRLTFSSNTTLTVSQLPWNSLVTVANTGGSGAFITLTLPSGYTFASGGTTSTTVAVRGGSNVLIYVGNSVSTLAVVSNSSTIYAGSLIQSKSVTTTPTTLTCGTGAANYYITSPFTVSSSNLVLPTSGRFMVTVTISVAQSATANAQLIMTATGAGTNLPFIEDSTGFVSNLAATFYGSANPAASSRTITNTFSFMVGSGGTDSQVTLSLSMTAGTSTIDNASSFIIIQQL